MSEPAAAQDVVRSVAAAAAELKALGFPGLDGVDAEVARAIDEGQGDVARMEAMLAAWTGMVTTSRQLLAGEMQKMQTLLSRMETSDPQRADMEELQFAFHEQDAGLEALARFFSTGERRLLHEAKDRIQRGARTAQRVMAQRGGPGR